MGGEELTMWKKEMFEHPNKFEKWDLNLSNNDVEIIHESSKNSKDDQTFEIFEGIALLVEKIDEITLIIADSIKQYPSWIEEKREFKPEDYPKIQNSYKIQISVQEGLNLLGWERGSQINYITPNNFPGRPVICMNLHGMKVQSYKMKNDEYVCDPNPHPRCQNLKNMLYAPGYVTLISKNNQPLTLFMLCKITLGNSYYNAQFHKLETEGAKNTYKKITLKTRPTGKTLDYIK